MYYLAIYLSIYQPLLCQGLCQGLSVCPSPPLSLSSDAELIGAWSFNWHAERAFN